MEEEQPDGGVHIYANNDGHCPISITMSFDQIKNFKANKELPYTTTIPSKADKHLVLELARENPSRGGGYSFGYTYNFGDAINASHDDTEVYLLPYKKGIRSLMGQGPNGRFSHKGIYAYDFNLDEGTPVLAARSGKVVMVREDSNEGCRSSKCQDKANYVIILHDDGSMAHYGHLKHRGVLVDEGQRVAQGQAIAMSGNTGWSSGPHLHFEVYIPRKTGQESVPLQFYTDDGPARLVEGKHYLSTGVKS